MPFNSVAAFLGLTSRLEKYPTLFKELERYLDEFHADRGDTQRAFSVYQDILLR